MMDRLTDERRARSKARMAAYYAANKRALLQKQYAKRKADPDARKKHDAAYRERNAENVRAAKEAYRLANLEKVRVAKERWRRENPEKLRAAQIRWSKNNPEKKRVYRENRRAREAAAAGQLSPDIAVRLLKLQRGKCAACKTDIAEKHEIDHILPLVLGGANDDSNMQLLCRTCNRSKGKKHPADFMRCLGLLL